MKIDQKNILDVSMLVANYNCGQFLREFIESILASSKLPKQLIIVDDGSTDNSRDILKEYESLAISDFVYLPENEGFASALNKGIPRIKSTYVMRADPDDIILPEKIVKQYKKLYANPELCGLGCNVVYFQSKSGKKMNASNFPVSDLDVKELYRGGYNGLQHPTVMMRSEVLKNNPYKQENVPAEDYDLYARLIKQGLKFGNLEEVLYNMRVHSASVSSHLQYSTIKKTCDLKEEIFGIKTSPLRRKFYYFHLLNYRRYLISSNFLSRMYYLILTVLTDPKKIIRRLS